MITVDTPEAGEFRDWMLVAEDYAQNRFPDWHPEMIKGFGSDIAWRMEGCSITETSMNEAYEDWESGQTPYGPHVVPKEGYDYKIWAKMMRAEARELTYSIASSEFVDEPWNIDRFVEGYLGSLTSPFTYERYVFDGIRKYRNGEVPYSPHWIPMTEEGIANRNQRIDDMRATTTKKDSFFDIMYHNDSGYGTLEKE